MTLAEAKEILDFVQSNPNQTTYTAIEITQAIYVVATYGLTPPA
jgi:hypothetical protein